MQIPLIVKPQWNLLPDEYNTYSTTHTPNPISTMHYPDSPSNDSSRNLHEQAKVKNFKRLAIVNCCSVVNKHVDLEVFLRLQDIKLLMGTESHLSESFLNSEVFPSGYTVYRKDRNIHGGGVFILVDESIPSSIIEIDSPCEIIWVHLHMQKTMDMILGSFYTPPHSPKTIWNDLSQCLSQIRHKFDNAVILLGGDFNCPGIDWSTEAYNYWGLQKSTS